MNFLFAATTLLLNLYLVTASDRKMNLLRPERELQDCPKAWEYAQYGKCQICPVGQVANTNKNGCEYCKNGFVRGNETGTELSECVAASGPCPGKWQYAQYGKCQTCPTGQVANKDKTGCEYCPNGSVRGTLAGGTELSGCVAATGVCKDDWQYAQYGQCQICPTGQNSNAKKTGCEYCPPGSIRGNSAGTNLASCTGVCAKWQHAQYGACQKCATGQVGGNGNVGCQYCPAGTVRGNAAGTAESGCVDATGPCSAEYQYAQYGQCQKCGDGQVHKDKKGCQFCAAGTVRGFDGKAESGCITVAEAVPPCLTTQYGQYGKCQTCPSGQIPNADRTGCMYPPKPI